MIYMDNASTTYVDLACVSIIDKVLLESWGNPSNIYSFGRKAREIVENAKTIIAECINASPDEIFFTSGASEGNSWALDQKFKIMISPFEHHNYLDAPNTEILPDKDVMFYSGFGTDVGYAHMLVSNETGELFNEVPKYFEYVHKRGGMTICDCTQAFGNVKVDVKELGCDFAIFSGHKFHAPKGVGFVYIKKEVQKKITPLIYGTQQNHKRGGTENVPYIAALAIAAQKASNNLEFKVQHSRKLMSTALTYLTTEARKQHIDFILTEDYINAFIPSTVSFCLKDVESEVIQSILSEDYSIFIGIGSGCSDGSMEANPTLKALGIPEEFIHGPIRLSFSEKNTQEEVKEVIDKILYVYKKVRYNRT